MRLRYILLIFLSLSNFISCLGQNSWPGATIESKPWTRWWWPGDAVNKENIQQELQKMADVGIGGVEITPIYGVKGQEEHFIEFLTPNFSEILRFTIQEANKLGMAVDLPPGSGWRCGGPFVTEEKGLWNLQIEKIKIAAGETWIWPGNKKNIATGLFVSDEKNTKIVLRNTNFTASQKGNLYLAVRLKSEDRVKRAADGGKGWAIDTFNKEITEWYLNEFWEKLGIDEGLLRCFFHDSFEYTGDFTLDFLEEFKERRGYDLTENLHILYGDSRNDELKARVKSDYRETLAELVLEAFIQPMTKWANKHKSMNRNQAHGSPGNILDLYAACDIPETEIFGLVKKGEPNVFIQKFASSAAHVTGKKLTSSESFTWLEEHWNVTTSDMMRATNRFFLAGINHMFFHGTCYSPQDAQWPGWLFYASTQVNDRNPLWREFPTLFKYIERTQTILQQSKPQNDLLIYWPYYDVAASDGTLFNHIGVSPDTTWFTNQPINVLSKELQNAGYNFDYISDKQLIDCTVKDGKIQTMGDAFYKAIVIPKTKFMPEKTLKQLWVLYQKGGVVCFDDQLPESVPGLYNLADREKLLEDIKDKFLAENKIGGCLENLHKFNIYGEESILKSGLHYTKATLEDNDWYLLVNTGIENVDKWIKLNSSAKSYVFYDPLNGEIKLASKNKDSIRIHLEPEHLIFVKCSSKRAKLPVYIYKDELKEAITLKGLWKIEFIEGGPVYPGNISTRKLLSWTNLGDDETQRFAGTAKYITEFGWDDESESAVLNLGSVKDCARIKLNGKDYGTLPGPLFSLNVDNLVGGTNLLEVEVTNVAANRIRDLDIRGINWKNFYDINFVNIKYKPFDASGWEVREAGLLGPVTLEAL